MKSLKNLAAVLVAALLASCSGTGFKTVQVE